MSYVISRNIMASVKKGYLSNAGEWWKHLRWTKRRFWHRERGAVKRDIGNQLRE